MDENMETLRREIKYRSRRSILEMDRLIGDFVAAKLDELPETILLPLRDMLFEMDQNLLASWRGDTPVPDEYALVFQAMREFHQQKC